MKIILASNWNIGITAFKHVQKCLAKIRDAKPNVLVHAGDYNGGKDGYKATKTIMKTTRLYLPNTPVLACLGNHDLWVPPKRGRGVPLYTFMHNLVKINAVMKEHNIHFLDTDGVYRHPDFPLYAFVGHTMWYRDKPNSNDFNFIPEFIEGDTHRWLYKKTIEEAEQNLQKLTEDDLVRIFISHFPLQGEQNQWTGDMAFGEYLVREYKIDKFLNGHAHQFHNGLLRYEAGSDYGKPKWFVSIAIVSKREANLAR